MQALQLLLKDKYEIGPGKNGIYILLFMTPWNVKFLIGCLSDSIPIFGSRKKAWMILLSVLLVSSTTIAATISFSNPAVVVFLLALSNAGNAGMDVTNNCFFVIIRYLH